MVKRLFFHFFDLREPHQVLLKTFSKAETIDVEKLTEVVAARLRRDDEPILLICQNGELSGQWGETLGTKGYKNIYVLKGGVSSLP